MKKSNGTALVAITLWISLLCACATSPANETAAKPSANRVDNEDVQSLLEELSIGDLALVTTSNGITHNVVVSEISDTVLEGSFPKVASSSSRGKLTEYGKQKTEKLRSQTLRSETVRLNIVDIKDVKIPSEIKKEEIREKKVEGNPMEALAPVAALAGVAVAVAAVAGGVLLLALFAV